MNAIYRSSLNASDKQVHKAVSNVMFRVTKKTAVNTPEEFFNEIDLLESDKVKIDLAGSKGNEAIISNLPVFPLAVACTMGSNHMVFIEEETTKKIKTVEFSLYIGIDGAIEFNSENYLSISTSFSDLEQLEIYIIGGFPTDNCYIYRNEIIQPNVPKIITLNGASIFVADPCVTLIDNKANGINVDLSKNTILDVSENLNDLVALQGKTLAYTRKHRGISYAVSGSIRGTATYTGGAWYPCYGCGAYDRLDVTSSSECYVYMLIPTLLGARVKASVNS